MLELFPEGFEEVDDADGVELVAYTDGAGQERFAAVFGAVAGRDVALRLARPLAPVPPRRARGPALGRAAVGGRRLPN